MDSVLLQYDLVRIKSWRSIDVVNSAMNDRCLREKFASLPLAENIQKKIINNYTTTSSLELAANTILEQYRFQKN